MTCRGAVQVESRRRARPQSVLRAYTAPNQALEPTISSFGFAYASGGGSPPALCGDDREKNAYQFGRLTWKEKMPWSHD